MSIDLKQFFEMLQFWPARQQALLNDIYELVRDGVPLSQAVDTILAIYDGPVKKVATQMSDALQSGHSLASGMDRWYPMPIIEIVRAGEEGGMLESALLSAVNYYGARINAWQMFSQSMVYPIIVILTALIMLVVIKNSVLVNFASIKPIVQWPAIGQQVFGLANLIQYWWWLVLFCVLAIIAGVYYTLQNLTGDLRYRLDQFPILSLYRSLTAARFMEVLGLLVTNGVSLKESLKILHRNAQPYLSWHLMLMEYRLSGGKENIADVLDTQLIQRDDMLRLRVLAKGKGFESALISLGKQALQRYSSHVAITVRIAGGLLLVIGAMLAAMMVLGIYSVGSVVAS